jgi:hypothetical protein
MQPYRWFQGLPADELFLDGGGALGVAYAKFMDTLEQHCCAQRNRRGDGGDGEKLRTLQRCSGSSIGALVAACIVVGVQPATIREQMGMIERRAQGVEVDVEAQSPGRRCGMASGVGGPRLPLAYATDALREGIAFVLRACAAAHDEAVPLSELTMADAEAVLGIELVVAVSVDRGRGPHAGCAPVIALSSRVHRGMLLRDALHASMAIPGVICPISYHGLTISDGSYGYTHPAKIIERYTAPHDHRRDRISAAVLIDSVEHYISIGGRDEKKCADYVTRLRVEGGAHSRDFSGVWGGSARLALDQSGHDAAMMLIAAFGSTL